MISTDWADAAARTSINSDSEGAFLERWSPDVHQSASVRLRRLGISPDCDLERDVAQEALIRLLLAFRKGQAPSERYIRRTIANAVNRAARQVLASARIELPDDSLDDLQAPETGESDVIAGRAVRKWASDLPSTLQQAYFNVYVLGKTQRSAAISMGVSQPRVAQLHAQLLSSARGKLERVAA